MKLQDKISTILSTQEAQKRAWPHGTSATPSRCPSRHTSQQLSTAAAGVAADVEVVPVAAAGDAAGWWQVVCVIFVAGGLVVVSHRLDYLLCAQAGDLSSTCCDLRQSSNCSKNRHKRLLSLFRLRRLPLLS